jgi:GntR family transcriptional regulator
MIMNSGLSINHHDPLPLYAQLERAIKSAITLNKLRLGDRLPTVRQLAVELRMNANTVARVYAELEHQGILRTRRGVGTFVEAAPSGEASRSLSRRKKELRALAEQFLADAAAKGFAKDELLQEIQHAFSQFQEKTHGR